MTAQCIKLHRNEELADLLRRFSAVDVIEYQPPLLPLAAENGQFFFFTFRGFGGQWVPGRKKLKKGTTFQ